MKAFKLKTAKQKLHPQGTTEREYLSTYNDLLTYV